MTTKCAGLNCSTTTGDHSPECRAEHAAAVAGGRFVKNPAAQPLTTELVCEIAARHSTALRGNAGSWDFAFPGYMDIYGFALDLLDTVTPSAPAVDAHPDDVAVDKFAVAMKEKLAQARAKGRSGWETCRHDDLSAMLRAHVEKGDPRDVANFCMFLWSLGAPIEPAFDAEQNQVLTGYDKNGEAVFGTAPPAAKKGE